MKSQFKRFSKSTLSVVLAFCMLVSCMTVGIIATDAAYDYSEGVGYTANFYLNSSSGTKLDKTYNNEDGKYYCIAYLTQNSTFNLNNGSNNYGPSSNNATSGPGAYNSNKYKYTGSTGLVKICVDETGDKDWYPYVWTETADMYVAGNASFFSGDDWTTNDAGNKMTLSGGVYTKTYTNVEANSNKEFKICDGSWSYSYPGSNQPLNVPTAGSTVVFTLTASNQNVSVNVLAPHTVNPSGGAKVNNSTSSATVLEESSFDYSVPAKTNYKIKSLTIDGVAVSAAAGQSSYSGTYTVTSSNSATINVVAEYEATLQKLATPTNVTLSQTNVDASPNGSVSLSWDQVQYAGSYKIYKGTDTTPVATVSGGSTTTYSILKKSSNSDIYYVVAVPSNANLYTESLKSSGVTLMVNKTSLPTPTVTMSSIDIKSGSSTTATISNYSSTLSSLISGGYATLTRGTRAYGATGGAYTTNTTVTSTTGSESLSPTSSIQYGYYMAVTTAGSEYYYQSSNSDFFDVFVAIPLWYLIGGVNGGDWSSESDDFKLTTYDGDNVFHFVYSADGQKYFSFSKNSTRYNPKGATYDAPCDVTTISTENDAKELEANSSSSSFVIPNAGTYVIYINQSTNKVWVEQNTRLLNIYAYTQTFNLSTDSHNTPTESTTGGTVQPSGEQLINKNTSTTLVATAKSGYTFQGWYNNTDFAVAHIVSTNASYTFTVTSDGNYYALFKQNTPTHYTLSVASVDNATVTATYNGTTLQEGSGTKSVPVGATVNYSISLSNGYKLDSSTPSGLTVGSGSFTMPASNTAVTISVSKITYNLTSRVTINNSTVTTSYGNLMFYKNSTCTTQITTAQIGDTFYAKYTPPTTNSAYYTSGAFSVYSGTGLTGPTSQATNIKKFVMGYSDATIAVNVVATTPSLTCAAMSGEVYANESFTYNGATVTPAIKSGFLSVSYQFQGTTNTTGTFTAPSTAGTYTMTVKASNKPTGINTAATASGTVDIVVKYRQQAVSYYVDMHNNNMTDKTIQIAIVKGMGDHTILIDNDGNQCSKTLSKQGSSAVYFASINTPTTKFGSNYNDVNIMVTYNGNSYVYNLPGGTDEDGKVDDLVRTKEMWLEAVNESSQSLSIQYSTTFSPESGSTPAVAAGYRRIYLAKPKGWETTETNWKNIKVYHWGNYNDMGWNNGISMNHLGYGRMPGAAVEDTAQYHFYYIDLPKYVNQDRTLNTDGTGNKVQNIIFQGWADGAASPSAQTGNIEEIPDSADFFILSKDGNSYVGTKSDEDVVIPTYARHASSLQMNVGQTGVNIAPVNTGAKVTYTSSNPSKVSVSDTGDITASASTVGETNNIVTITVKVYGSIGDKIRDTENGGGDPHNGADAVIYTVSVSVHDTSKFNGFNIMAIESQTYTVSVPQIGTDQPGYFDMSNNGSVITVLGLLGVDSSTKSAIINQSTDNPTSFTVKYAKANSMFSGYSGIEMIGTIVTKSNHNTTTGKRYGLKQWMLADNSDPQYTISRKVANGTGIETATTIGVTFSSASATYRAIFEEYQYVDVTFTFNYDEYKPKKVDADGNVVSDNADGMIQYPYDATWADENNTNGNYSNSHNTKTFVVQDYEVRYRPENGETFAGNLRNAAAIALGVEPNNNYYDYNIPDTVTATTPSNYKAESTINLIQSVKQYKVYVNGVQTKDNNNNPLTYTYQEYAEPSVQNPADWYAVDSSAQNASTDNAPLLATGVNSYKFRVKGSANSTNTYLRTVTATNPHGNDFLRSEVDFSHYEVTHQGNTPTNMKEYLLQNFYIADFFSPAEVLDYSRPKPNNPGEYLPYDDAQFVGGGVVYYSVTNDTPFANAVSSGYVNGSDGKINASAIKEMLKSNIEAQYAKDNIAGAVGENEAMKIAYGTEIAATKNKEGGFNTGIIYRYLPLNQYKRDGNGTLLDPDQDGNYAYDVNTNTFRYSNSLQSYQYVYASGNENKETNTGKNMRLYSYYVYSYVTYDQETNVPVTKYEIVLSDNYSDASTYWAGNPNPDPTA